MDSPAEGDWNMAVDEVLLESAAQRGIASLRVYAWHRPTLSLGYFQSLSQRASHVASLACPVIRRRSGGGAIVHDQEITYSLAVPSRLLTATRPEYLYDRLHRAWCTAIGKVCGIEVERADCRAASVSDAFLCFQRRSPFDLTFRGVKILGSALVRRSTSAPDLPGLADLLTRNWVPDDLVQNWISQLEIDEPWVMGPASLASDERTRVNYLVRTRYGTREWTAKRP
jgi:lipoate-protein ligase A